jgi:pimeloyl-ACP methyl ester carboxylesterase
MQLALRTWGPTDAPRTAVLVHGVTGWSGTWWRVGPALAADGWRAIALDLRCHGASPCDGPFKLVDLADDVAATAEALLEGRGVDLLIGHSLGAMTALVLLGQRPGFAGRVVLEDPPGRSSERDFPALAAAWRADVAQARSDAARAVARAMAANPRWDPQDAAQDVGALARCEVETVIASFGDRWAFDTPSLVPDLRVPTLLLLGTEGGGSVITGDARREAIAALPPGSSWQTFDAGHVVHRDQFEEYVAAVRAFTR